MRHVADANTLDIKLNKVDVDNGYDAFSLDNTRETLSDQPGEDSLDMTSMLVRWNRVGERFTSTVQVSDVDADAYTATTRTGASSVFDRFGSTARLINTRATSSEARSSGA